MEKIEYNLEQEIAEDMKNRLVKLASPLLDEMPPSADNPKRMSLNEYIIFCNFYLGLDNPISDSLIERTCGVLNKTNNLAKYLSPKTGFCYAVMPCSMYGNPFTEIDIKVGKYLSLIAFDQMSGDKKKQVYFKRLLQLLPVEVVEKCGFYVDSYNLYKDNLHPLKRVSPEEQAATINNVKIALTNLQQLFVREEKQNKTFKI